MQRSRAGFSYPLLFALSAIIASPEIARAQDMPPIWTPLAPPPAAAAPPPVAATPASVPPSAAAVVSPAVTVPSALPTVKKQVAAAGRPAKPRHAAKASARQEAKFAALTKRLTAVHAHPATRHVAVRAPEPTPPRGMIVPPPGYYYPPPPYEQLVYGGPPRGLYGGWGGYRGRYPY